jgi:hypothetical protein
MNIDFGALNSHLQEYNTLSNKPRHTKEDERRMSYLQTAISALKSGASLDDVTDAYRRDIAKRYELNLTIDKRPDAREIEARGWQQLTTERRNMDEGSPLNRLGSYTGLGYFVPTGFFPQVFTALLHMTHCSTKPPARSSRHRTADLSPFLSSVTSKTSRQSWTRQVRRHQPTFPPPDRASLAHTATRHHEWFSASNRFKTSMRQSATSTSSSKSPQVASPVVSRSTW